MFLPPYKSHCVGQFLRAHFVARLQYPTLFLRHSDDLHTRNMGTNNFHCYRELENENKSLKLTNVKLERQVMDLSKDKAELNVEINELQLLVEDLKMQVGGSGEPLVVRPAPDVRATVTAHSQPIEARDNPPFDCVCSSKRWKV